MIIYIWKITFGNMLKYITLVVKLWMLVVNICKKFHLEDKPSESLFVIHFGIK